MIDKISERENLWRHFFKNPRRHYNMYMYKLMEFPQYIIYDKDLMDNKKAKWSEFFGNENPICLEIGCGSGGFSKEIARQNPNKNFIALELRFKRLWSCAKKCSDIDLKNIVFLRRRAEDLKEFLAQEISEVYINFPDPWENEEKNRVIQKSFFDSLDNILKVEGKIFFKTNHDVYHEDVANLVKDLENYEVVYKTSDLHKSEKAEQNIRTEFENLFLHKHDKNINYLEIIKIK